MKGSEAMTGSMTNAEFNAFLETLAKLIESKAQPLPKPPTSFGKPRHKKDSDRQPSKQLPQKRNF